MDGQDGQVPAPRRPALPPRRSRRAAESAPLPFGTAGEDGPRVADLSALLGDIDALRLTLQTDLSLAAAALDAGAPDLAGELVDGDLAEVRAFGRQAVERLHGMDAPQDVEPVEARPLPRRRILSAAPLMAAAAALIGFVAFVPDRGTPPSPETTMTSAAMAGFELTRLAQAGAPDEAIAMAAEELNDEVAELIAKAATDPAAAQQALMLLNSTTQVLSSHDDSGVIRSVIAETQLLRARLREALPVVAQRPVRKATKPVPVPLVKQEPEKARESSAPSSPKPAASPKPSPKPSPSASPAKPSPSPQPSGSPGSEEQDGPLPQPGDDSPALPGW